MILKDDNPNYEHINFIKKKTVGLSNFQLFILDWKGWTLTIHMRLLEGSWV
jgi:hypothetical protein